MPPKPAKSPKPAKRIFLVDAMGYIFRAYFAPMDRLQTSAGIPTKVPYLFATMMRRLFSNEDRLPDYVAVAFDVEAAAVPALVTLTETDRVGFEEVALALTLGNDAAFLLTSAEARPLDDDDGDLAGRWALEDAPPAADA